MNAEKKGMLKWAAGLIVILCLIILWLGFGERGLVNLYKMEKERLAHIERIEALEREKNELLEEIERLRNDKQYIEAVARRKLDLIKEGETLYRFVKESDRQPRSRDGHREADRRN